jgi:alkylation response protein AidB-like acyl-CoA dehydrogenase
MPADDNDQSSNFFLADRNLLRLLGERAPAAFERWRGTLADFGAWVASDVDKAASYTDRVAPPVLEPYDRDGSLVNRIRHNPAWENVAAEVYRRGAVGLNYRDDPAPFVVTFAMGYLLSQADVSLHCPVTMTGAVAYVLDRFAPPAIRRRYLPLLVRMDGHALTGGTWVTEMHGGSDVGGTTTVARRAGDEFRLTGLKWFASNANGGLALATARPEGAGPGSRGLGLYLVPTHLDDGSPNAMRIRRLKDKLGTIGVPTGEIDLDHTWAVEVAPPPEGFKIMMEALEFSRIHNAMGSAGVQRRAFSEALAYARRRVVFGRPMTAHPMVQDEILKIMTQLEAGAALAFEAAWAFDDARGLDAQGPDTLGPERTWARLATALAKYQTAEEANVAARAAIEIIGANAYTYDYVTPRLLRDAQALTVWEGPANIQALEVMRLLGPRYGADALLAARVASAVEDAPAPLMADAGAIRAAMDEIASALAFLRADTGQIERHARRLMAYMADVLAAVLLFEEARRDLAADDGRKALVARLFVEQRLRPPARRGIGPDRDWAQNRFDALVDCEPIEVSALG